MKIGFNLLLWTGLVEPEHHGLLGQLKATGYDGVEIPLFGGDVGHYTELGRVLSDQGLGCTAVTVMPDQDHSCVSPDASSR
ncbi:MAG: sugar phosphate isomerase/epimerase, partial [Phycisphaerae bacterium]|nr:sugar phosphate isomerase/epimerase [Phycisphaerae bacterium]